MRLAISNIAWDVAEDEAIAKLLHRLGVDAIDVAPGKYFPEPAKATDEDIVRVKNWWSERGIEITGMQALLFGTTGLNVFGLPAVQEAMLQHLTAVCRIGAGLGATRLVFGSPKNRDRTGLSDQQAMAVAVPFFQRLGDIAQSHGVFFCLEPNPSCYGANFMTTSAETAQVVRRIAHPAIRMQFDTGALTINGEDPAAVLQDCATLIGHIHASEPDLLPLGDGGADHAKVLAALAQHLPNHLVSIEMLATRNEPHLVAIERALTVAVRASWQVPTFETPLWLGRQHPCCVVIPVINEGARIKSLLSRMAALQIDSVADIIIVDGGSSDGSLALEPLQGQGVRGLLVKTGPGKLSAQLRCGYAFALDQGYEGIVTIDGNDKDDPQAIPGFIEALKQGVDFVQASRFIAGGAAENTPKSRDFAIRFIHAPMLSRSSGFKWTDTTQGFRAYSRKMLLDPRIAPFRDVFNSYELLAYLSYRAPQLGYRCLELPTIRRYPKGEVPTKISSVKGNLAVLQVLLRACRGAYNPDGYSK